MLLLVHTLPVDVHLSGWTVTAGGAHRGTENSSVGTKVVTKVATLVVDLTLWTLFTGAEFGLVAARAHHLNLTRWTEAASLADGGTEYSITRTEVGTRTATLLVNLTTRTSDRSIWIKGILYI